MKASGFLGIQFGPTKITKNNTIMSNPLKSDNRYTITPEVSKGKLRPTLRFNGEYIARSPFRETLVLRAACHRAHLRGAITFENQPA